MCFTVNVNDKNAFYSHAQVCNSQPAVIQRLHSDREKRSRLARASLFVYLLLLLVCRLLRNRFCKVFSWTDFRDYATEEDEEEDYTTE